MLACFCVFCLRPTEPKPQPIIQEPPEPVYDVKQPQQNVVVRDVLVSNHERCVLTTSSYNENNKTSKGLITSYYEYLDHHFIFLQEPPPIPRPVPVRVPDPIPVPVRVPVPVPVARPVPRPVPVPIRQPIPVPLRVPVPVPQAVPRPIPIPVRQPVPVPTQVPVPVPQAVPVPTPVRVPYNVGVPVREAVPVLQPFGVQRPTFGSGLGVNSGFGLNGYSTTGFVS